MADANLVKFLNPSFRSFPPTNVRFVFNEDGVMKEVTAHTQILACSSEVFNREFFGALATEKEVEIKDASQEVFQTMIEFIYNKKPKFKELDLKFLISLYYLADKYDIQDLCSNIISTIPKHLVVKKDVLPIAMLAEENIVHPPLSEALYDAAANFMKEVPWKNKFESILDLFTDESEEHGMVVFKLVKRAKKRKLEEECIMCKQTTCLDGKQLSFHNFCSGAKATNNSVRVLKKIEDNGHVISETYGDIGELYLSKHRYYYKCK